ncbi:M23 family metallopeptidase [Mucilaginibacter sp. PAMB04274]|uniref:M23 family metallopeptidase n=1 Tax=Mucilaginibacter sp. PAMB04274 TaxID=3138568 RepID=UPI0031F6C722
MKALIYLMLISSSILARAQIPGSFSLPLDDLQLNSRYGYRVHPLTGKVKFHAGVDLAARSDTVFAVLDGRVTKSGYNHSLGLYVNLDHGGGLESSYGHLSQCWVLEGDTIRVGSPIGLTGATGQVTGEHLHFAIKFYHRFLNPLALMKALLLSQAGHQLPNMANHE